VNGRLDPGAAIAPPPVPDTSDERRHRRLALRMPVPLRRMGVFALMPLLSALSNVVLLPAVSSSFGQAGWTSVVLGQGIGAAASVVCSLQWPTEGPALVARAAEPERTAIMRASMRSRTATLLGCVPVILLLIWVVQPADLLVCALSAISATLIGLSPAWFLVGIGRPGRLVWLEGVPRLVGNLVSFGLILGGAPLWTYPATMVATAAVTAVLSWLLLSGGLRSGEPAWTNAQNRRSLGFATLARTLDAGYSFIAGPIVAVLAPAAYPVFGACDRLAKVALGGLAVVPQGAAGWVSEPAAAEERMRRVRLVSVSLLPLALAIFVFLTVATPFLVHVLFAGTVAVGFLTSALTGAIVSAAFLGQALFMTGLAPTGNAARGYRYLVVGFAVGLPALIVGTLAGGVVGAQLGYLAAAATLVALSLKRIRRAIPRRRQADAEPAAHEAHTAAEPTGISAGSDPTARKGLSARRENP
jgi:hypothetical protein